MSQNRGGDSLAQGAVRFQFQPAGSKKTQQEWDDMWEGFDADKYRRNADAPTNGDAGTGFRETAKR